MLQTHVCSRALWPRRLYPNLIISYIPRIVASLHPRCGDAHQLLVWLEEDVGVVLVWPVHDVAFLGRC